MMTTKSMSRFVTTLNALRLLKRLKKGREKKRPWLKERRNLLRTRKKVT